jgi:hypothetical protein
MVLDPATGERFLIPVDEVASGSAVALLEPWACVEKSYASAERNTLAPDGRLLVVTDPGRTLDGVDALIAASRSASIVAVLADDAQAAALATIAGRHGAPWRRVAGLAALDGRFDDIVYLGSDADRIEALQDLLAPRATIDIVLGGAAIARPVAVDVGRIHYDLVRWVGTAGADAAEGYARVPANGELRAGDVVAIVGAAGPMGFMHVIRAVTSGLPGLRLAAIDIDDARLAHLARIAGPFADADGVEAEFVNSRVTPPEQGAFSYVGVMVPAPALVVQALAMAAPGARINLFAGFAVGTRADVDLTSVLANGIFMFGTSGSEIPDMRAVLARLEAGRLDTNVSVDAVSGMEGVGDALAAVEARSSGGKIVVYPSLHELGMIRLGELPGRLPAVAALLHDGRWTREAEAALLATAGSA